MEALKALQEAQQAARAACVAQQDIAATALKNLAALEAALGADAARLAKIQALITQISIL